MKSLPNLLIGASAIAAVLAVVSKVSQQAIAQVGPRALAGLTVVLLLFAIALSVKK